MNITPTPEVVTEIAARSTYLLSNLLAWIKMNAESPSKDTEAQIEKWWTRTEEYLKSIGALDFQGLNGMIGELTTDNCHI